MAREFDLETQEWIEIPDKPVDIDKLRENILRLWAEVLGDDDVPQNTRIRVARDAATYLFPKYQAVAQVDEKDLTERLGKAMEESGKIIDGRATKVLPNAEP